MKETLRKFALPLALAASLAGCSTLNPSVKPEAVDCPESSRLVDGACLDTEWSALKVLERRCEDDLGGEVEVVTVEHSPTWVCNMRDGMVFWEETNPLQPNCQGTTCCECDDN